MEVVDIGIIGADLLVGSIKGTMEVCWSEVVTAAAEMNVAVVVAAL